MLHYRGLLDQHPTVMPGTEQDALRVILASWLLNESAHKPYAGAGSPFHTADMHECLQHLPVLDGHEFVRLTGTFAHVHDPRWHQLVLAAWKVVDDPGYMSTLGNSQPPHGKVGAPTTPASSTGSVSSAAMRALESYDWARKHASHLFPANGTKYPKSAFEFVTDPTNGCPAYEGKKPALGYESWMRYVRLSRGGRMSVAL